MTNELYEIEIGSPLLRPGLTIKCWVSKRYVASTTKDLMAIVREINEKPDSPKQQLQKLLTQYNDGR
jgi:hypothetical protein